MKAAPLLQLYCREVTVEPSTEDLPFLLVHGPLVWKAILAILIAAVLLVVWAARRRLATRRARAALAAIDRGGEAEGVLRGTLGGDGDGPVAATLWAARRDPRIDSLHDWRADQVWLETALGRVLLDGPIRVGAGSRAASARNGVPRATGDAHLRAAGESAPWLHRRRLRLGDVRCSMVVSVAPGDEVVAAGRLERSPGGEAGGYRTADVAWTMRAPDDRPIAVGARRPRAVAARLPLIAVLAGTGFTGCVGWQVMVQLGDSPADACGESSPYPEELGAAADRPVEVTDHHPCALAAASPGRQPGAAESLARRLDRHPYRDERALRQLLAATSMSGSCADVTEQLMRHGRLEAAVDAARACGDRVDEYLALAAQGRFEEAAAVPVAVSPDVPRKLRIATFIAAGKWMEAAAAVEKPEPPSEGRPDPDTPVREVRLEWVSREEKCLAELLRHHGGDRGAAARLRARAAEPGGEVCVPALSETVPMEERRRMLRAAKDGPQLVELGWAAGEAMPQGMSLHYSAENFLAMPDSVRSTMLLPMAWLSALAEAALPADAAPAERANVLRWRTAAHVLDGDLTAAAATAREAVRMVAAGADRSGRLDDLPLLPALVALYTPETRADFDFTAGAQDAESAAHTRRHHELLYAPLRLRRGDAEGIDRPADLLTILRSAQQGGGQPLARALHTNTVWFTSADVLAVLPRIARGRDAVARQLAWSPDRRGASMEWKFPWYAVSTIVVRRDLLRLAGVPREAARWDAMYRRFDRMLEDRRRLIALVLLDP